MTVSRYVMLCLVLLPCCFGDAAENTDSTEKAVDKPSWSVQGRVVDGNGNPMPDVTVAVHTGIGTLLGGGRGTTDEEGEFDVAFGPGIQLANDDVQMQYATVFVNKPGFFERDLCRHGGLAMALRIPDDFNGWGGRTREDIILPGQPRELKFQLLPAASCAGTVVDENGKPMAGCKVSLKGKDMPPSSSVAASARADQQGRFELDSIPTRFEYQILVNPANPAPPWNAWASGPMAFHAVDEIDAAAVFTQEKTQFVTDQLEIRVKTAGVNWKRALEIGSLHQTLERDGETLRLELHPPGLPLAKTVLPESIKVSIGLLPGDADSSAASQPSFSGSIDPSAKRGSLAVPETFAWDFARVRQIRTKLGYSLEVSAEVELLGPADRARRLLVSLTGLDQSGDLAYDNWRVVSDKRMRPIEIPRATLSDIRTIQIGIRELAADEIETYPETRSRTDLRITAPDKEGTFTIRFENPADGYAGGRQSLDPEKHQVIFQVFGKDAAGKTHQKVFRQLKAKEKGGYSEVVTIRPEFFDHSRVSITFVTIQPEHDQWVDAFFQQGKGTSYRGLWIGDAAPLKKILISDR